MLDVRLIKGKEAENTSSDKRYRLILSDGRNVFSCIPKKQRFSTVSKSGLAEKTSNDEWQADDASSIGVVLEKA
ncbi:unnamed protein product [Rotaria socialis]